MYQGEFEYKLSLDDRNERFLPLNEITEQHDLPVVNNEPGELDEIEMEHVFDESDSPIELDFDTVAQTVLERVMSDESYKTTLADATSRASLRNPCTVAVEESIRDHFADEPEVFRQYFSNDDFNDKLFDYVLRQSWENRPQPEQMQPEQAQEQDVPQFTEITDPAVLAEIDEIFPETAQTADIPIMVIDQAARQNFNLFALTFPRIADGTHQSERYKSENNRTLTISHDTTNAGLIHTDVSYFTPEGRQIYDPMLSATANFERRMLIAENFANDRTGEDIGLLTLSSGTDEEKVELSLKLAEFISDVRSQKWTLEEAEVFRDADGNELLAEPKANFDEFLKERATRESKAHGEVQRLMYYYRRSRKQNKNRTERLPPISLYATIS
jgi:hypothetical protein